MDEEKPQKKERSEAQLAALAAAREKAYAVRRENAALRKQEREVEAAALKDLVKERRERVHKEHKQLVQQEEPEPEEDDEEELVEETRVVKKRRKKPPIRRRVVVVEESDDEEVPEEDVTEVHVPKPKPPDPLDRVRDRLFGAY